MSDPYVYPGSTVLRNKFSFTDQPTLDYHERELSTVRARAGVPIGDFDLKHLQAIHRHLFQDVYEWAGQIRTVEISKDGHQFQLRKFIESGMSNVHGRIVKAVYFRGTRREDFASEAGQIMGDVNYVHPFREGNGRTQMLYLKQLVSRAGHSIDLRKIEREPWMEASRRAHGADYAPMSACIAKALDPERSRTKSRDQDRGRG